MKRHSDGMQVANSMDVDLMQPDHSSLRIAVVTETYPPDINGVARTLSVTVEGLRLRGHVLRVVRPKHPEDLQADPTHYPRSDVLVKGLPIPFYRELRMGLPAKKMLTQLWTAHRPDLVHIATEGPLGWSALKVAKKLKLPVSTDFRTNFHAYSQHYGVGWLKRPVTAYLKKFHNAADSTMVPTQQLKDELVGLGFQRVHVVPRGVDVALFDPQKRSLSLRNEWNCREGDVVLLCVSRMAPEKNLHVLLRAYEDLRLTIPDLRLVMVGDGPLRQTFESAHPSVIFTGFLGEAELAAHYASANVFAFPSITETFGNVSLEAMASGLPVVAFDDAAARFLIQHDANGLLAACGDEVTFQQHLNRLAQDPNLRHALGQAARSTALTIGWPSVIQKIEEIMLSLVPSTA